MDRDAETGEHSDASSKVDAVNFSSGPRVGSKDNNRRHQQRIKHEENSDQEEDEEEPEEEEENDEEEEEDEEPEHDTDPLDNEVRIYQILQKGRKFVLL